MDKIREPEDFEGLQGRKFIWKGLAKRKMEGLP